MVDYVISDEMIVPAVFGLLQVASYSCIQIDLKWKKALIKQSCVEHTKHGRETAILVAEKLFSKYKQKVPFTKAVIAIEVALDLNNVDDVQIMLQEQFTSVAELKTILAAQLQQTTSFHIKQEHIQTKLTEN